MRLAPLLIALFATLCASLAGTPAAAQFSPAIMVDDRAITQFEIDQRARLLELFRTPGNPQQLAREQLIEDRLKQQAFDRIGLRITDEALTTELDAFAARANLSVDQFVTILAQNGVERETWVEFVRMGVSWRDFIRSRFGGQVNITEADINRAIGQGGGAAEGVEVLLSEIIIPAPPQQAARAQQVANQIAATTSTAQFSAFARQYSALPSRANGGRLDWVPLSNFPAPLHPLILDLGLNEVTAPIPITNGIALFQMRGIREVPRARAAPSAIDYAVFYLPGGLTETGLAAARNLELRSDTCDDLYGAARGLAPEVLERQTLPPAEIPQAIALRLATLDPGEADYSLTTGTGDTLLFVMLCSRQVGEAGADREAVANQIRQQRLSGYADALLEELRAAADIRQ